MKKKLFKLSLFTLSCFFAHSASAQTAYISKSVGPGGDADVSDSLYIGPGPHFIDGTWEIYSQYVLIDQNATFIGTGKIQFWDPGMFTGVSSSTKLNGNLNMTPIDIDIELMNSNSIELAFMSFPADLITAGWVESSEGTLSVGKDLNFGVDGAHLILGDGITTTGILLIDDDGTLSGYSPARHVVTNNYLYSFIQKINVTSAFTFPVGISPGDYTPASVSSASANLFNVGVQDYANSPSPEQLTDGLVFPADGMNRTWHITGFYTGISTTISLQHNSATNQTGFNDASHFVTQCGTTTPNTSGDYTVGFSSSPWQTNTLGSGVTGTLSTSGAVAGSSLRSRTYSSGVTTSAGANEGFFTKSSDPIHPLPIQLQSFTAQNNNCDVVLRWNTGVEEDILNFRVEHSTNGRDYKTLNSTAPAGNNSSYSYVHKDPSSGSNLYRLAVDNSDRLITFSPVRNITVDCNQAASVLLVRIYPNPTDRFVTISGMGNNKFTIRILNLQGQIVKESNNTSDKEILDMENLPSAPYVLQLVQDSEVKMNVKLNKK